MTLFDKIFKRNVSNDIETIINTAPKKVCITKEEYRYRKEVIDKWIKDYKEKAVATRKAKVTAENVEVNAKNNKCEKCGHSDSTVNKFIKKGVQAFKYNHCNNCGHEWEYIEPTNIEDDIRSYNPCIVIPHFLDHVVCALWTNKFDPTDITCEYNSAEEADKTTIANIYERYADLIQTFPLEIMYYTGYQHAYNQIINTEEIFNKPFHECGAFDNKNGEMYWGRFTEKMEDILINKLGVKKLFN